MVVRSPGDTGADDMGDDMSDANPAECIRLTKAFTRNTRIHWTDTWVSNGHWAIRKDRVTNPTDTIDAFRASLGAGADVTTHLTDTGVESASTPRSTTRRMYTRTNWIYVAKDVEHVAYVDADGLRWVWIARHYADRMDLDVLYGAHKPARGPAINVLCDQPSDAPTMAIMPCRIGVTPPGCTHPLADPAGVEAAA